MEDKLWDIKCGNGRYISNPAWTSWEFYKRHPSLGLLHNWQLNNIYFDSWTWMLTWTYNSNSTFSIKLPRPCYDWQKFREMLGTWSEKNGIMWEKLPSGGPPPPLPPVWEFSHFFTVFFCHFISPWLGKNRENMEWVWVRPHRALDGGQFRFWSNLKVPFLYTFGIYWSFGIFYHTFDEQQGRFGLKVLKKLTSKTEKLRKHPKTANFGHILVYLSSQICFAWILPWLGSWKVVK